MRQPGSRCRKFRIWELVWFTLKHWEYSFNIQGSTIIITLPFVITYLYQNFGICDIHGQIPKSIYQASYPLPRDFLTIFPKVVFI